MQPELSNCLTEANQKLGQLNWENQNEINEKSKQGFWLVLFTAPFHCASTDAVVGGITGIFRECHSQAEAEAIWHSEEALDLCGDHDFKIVGPEAPEGYQEVFNFCLPTSTDAGINGGDWADVTMFYDEVVCRIAEIEQELNSYTDWADVPCNLTYELRVFRAVIE